VDFVKVIENGGENKVGSVVNDFGEAGGHPE
jgi:hypothetical protein